MRVLIDAMCSEFGGIATYVDNLLRTWPQDHPDDDLHVIAPPGAAIPQAGLTVHRVPVRRPAAVFRPLMQTREVRRLTRLLDPAVILATLPSTTLVRAGAPIAVVVYDLRHELRPAQFSTGRRMLRRVSYGRGYAVADAFLSISRRSLNDLHRLHPRTERRPGSVVHLAADHVLAWPREAAPPYAIAFGHHTNKNTDLVLGSWAQLVRSTPSRDDVLPLKILGLSGAERARVETVLHDEGLNGLVEIAPFLPAGEFESTMAGARLVVFPSDFEGFGLPVLEAMRLGIPVVVGPDEAVLEIAGGHATVIDSWTAEAVADAVSRALAVDDASLAAAEEHAATFTWTETVRRTRAALAALTSSGERSQHL